MTPAARRGPRCSRTTARALEAKAETPPAPTWAGALMPVPLVATDESAGEAQSQRPRARTVEHRFGVLLTVAYDGRRFSGWARQTNARSVAGELDGAIAAIDPKASQTRGLSRTDAGVHAR